MYRKLTTFAFATMLTAGLAFAQDTTNTSAQSTQPAQTNVGQTTDTNEPLYKGCVSGTKDNYVLTSEDGKAFRLHSDKDINEHVGKFVEVRGTEKKEGNDSNASTGTAAMSQIDVADLKNVDGKSCPATSSDNSAVKSDDKSASAEPVQVNNTQNISTASSPTTTATDASNPAKREDEAKKTTDSSTAASTQSTDAAAKPEADKMNDQTATSTDSSATKSDSTAASTTSSTEPAKSDSSASNPNFYGTQSTATSTTNTDSAKAEDKPVTDSTAVATEQKSEPVANNAASTDQSATSTEAPKADAAAATTTAAPAADQSATASNADAQKPSADNSSLPQTASPLPLLGLLGFASTGIGFLARRRK
jgi:hypothetical protein